MCPAGIIRLFKSTAFVGAERTVHSSGRRLQAAPTQPLALWDVGNSVTLLMHSQVTHVTEQDDITVLTLAVITNTANGILIHQRAGVTLQKQKTKRNVC